MCGAGSKFCTPEHSDSARGAGVDGAGRAIQPLALHPDTIRTVTAASFTPLVLEGAGPIVVEFMTYGCGHCRTIEPVVQKVAEMLATTETIFRVNIAVESELADSYRVASTPTFVMFLDGAEVGRAEGPRPTVPSVMRTLTQMFPHA